MCKVPVGLTPVKTHLPESSINPSLSFGGQNYIIILKKNQYFNKSLYFTNGYCPYFIFYTDATTRKCPSSMAGSVAMGITTQLLSMTLANKGPF